MRILIDHQKGPGPAEWPVEIVERKGLGHPDTICDMLSEQLSVALSKHYVDHFGLVLHHNVDKALLAAGQSEPAFGGGRIIEPIDIFLSGRATRDVRGKVVPVRELAEETATVWLRANMHALNIATDVRFHCLVRPGSPELVNLFMRQRDQGVFLANDTSCGVGFAPLTELERVVLAVERKLNTREFKTECPETGEDIKVMGVREHDEITLTVSCAFIGRFIKDIGGYRDAKHRLQMAVLEIARSICGRDVAARVNVADDSRSVFLTVSGTSAEAGDDGQTGRGNRANGLITPCRPMTLEASAGKNPVTHVGKLYNAAASRLAAALVAEVPPVIEAECYLVSEIGAPIDRPHIAHVSDAPMVSHPPRSTNRSAPSQNVKLRAFPRCGRPSWQVNFRWFDPALLLYVNGARCSATSAELGHENACWWVRRHGRRAARPMHPWPRSRTDRWQPADRRRRASGTRR